MRLGLWRAKAKQGGAMRGLTGTVQHSDWGDRTEIPRILGIEPDGRPWAEYWLGAHPGGPSSFDDDPGRTLAAHLSECPQDLGSSADHFGYRLPYLLKILSAAGPLSLQVHPTREQAVAGFARESLVGLPTSHPERSYKDDWPKPEAVVALTRFEGLVGFRDPHHTAQLFEDMGVANELSSIIGPLRERTEALALQEVFLDVLTIRKRRHLVDLVLARAVELLDVGGELGEFARTAVEIDEHFPGDPGIVAALLLNRFTLEPGEATALEAGVMHAYLRGTAVEIMASSDNVIRGGLTHKHIDVDGLLGLVKFEQRQPKIFGPEGTDGLYRYPTEFPEFELWLASPISDKIMTMPRTDSPRIALVTDGEFQIHSPGEQLTLARGQAAFLSATEQVALKGAGQMFIAASGM